MLRNINGNNSAGDGVSSFVQPDLIYLYYLAMTSVMSKNVTH